MYCWHMALNSTRLCSRLVRRMRPSAAADDGLAGGDSTVFKRIWLLLLPLALPAATRPTKGKLRNENASVVAVKALLATRTRSIIKKLLEFIIVIVFVFGCNKSVSVDFVSSKKWIYELLCVVG
jgi:hypothetical protein